MTDEIFLPEDDQDFLRRKIIPHRFHCEGQGETQRRAIEFVGFTIPPNLYKRQDDGTFVPAERANVLILIPKGYSKTRLDSWYVQPALILANGAFADRANSEQVLFERRWQFWSRHLLDSEWRENIDGLETYIQYIRSGLQNP